MDNSLQLLTEGYAWLPDRRRRSSTFRTRLMGQRAICVGGVDAAKFFYDERHIRRHCICRHSDDEPLVIVWMTC
jgi:fatty-acid peroxygenase